MQDLQVGDELRYFDGFKYSFYQVTEIKEHYWGDGATGYKLEKEGSAHFWARPEDLSKYELFSKRDSLEASPDNPTPEELEFRRAIHLLQDACNDEVVLMQDVVHSVYLIPAILGPDAEPPSKEGTVEYQVCDGLPGHRSTSFDCYHLRAAVELFNKIVHAGGWDMWRPKKRSNTD